MDENELTAGLVLLAEEAEPAPIDVAAVMTAAKARGRHRKASIVTAFATVAVIGALGMVGGSYRTTPGDDSVRTTTPVPQTVPTLEVVQNSRSAELTSQLAAAWPGIKPPGVTAERNPWHPDEEPLVFYGQQYESADPDFMAYLASASLVDAQGRSQLSISVSHPGDQGESRFKPCAPGSGCTYHELSDGTQVNSVVQPTAGTTEVATSLDVLRPDGLRYRVSEHNSYPQELATNSRPTPLFSVEGLLKFATVLGY